MGARIEELRSVAAPPGVLRPARSRPFSIGEFQGSLLFLCTRLAFGVFLLTTSFYCILLYVPFSYFGFIHNPLIWWLPAFVHWHAVTYLGLVAAVGATLLDDLRSSRPRASAASFLVINACVGTYMALHSSLAHLAPDFSCYMWSMLCLFPLMWLGVIDWEAAKFRQPPRISVPLPGSLPARAASASVLAPVAFGVSSCIRAFTKAVLPVSRTALVAGVAGNLVLHFALFSLVGGLLYLTARIALRARSPEFTYLLLSRGLACWLCTEAVQGIAFQSLTFSGGAALAVAAVIGLCLVFYWTGWVARWKGMSTQARDTASHPAFWSFAAVSLVVAAYAIPAEIGTTDWDFVGQKFAVIALWVGAFALTGAWRMRPRKSTLAVFAVFGLLAASGSYVGFRDLARNRTSDNRWTGIIESYAGTDISFKTVSDILWRIVDDGHSERFNHFLLSHTNLGRDVSVAPADLRLVPALAPITGPRPNIFLFVIDSLRQDYVPPYNADPAVAPEMAQFAADSIVFRNAFTRYAGTALSEPAIWVGAMQLHKQYIEPFYPMNNLERLLERGGYENYIAMDPILQQVVSPSMPVHRLGESTKMWGDFDFVPLLQELALRIDANLRHDRPVFAYMQPQNVHTMTLARQQHGRTRREVSLYELKRMDAAFGQFVRFLKDRGLYQNSIIILTSDHGDAYGEFGRYGHADFLFPEVMRIPLIIHLPPSLRQNMTWDVQKIAFSTDITPSLYYLLGERPTKNQELFGRPLFSTTMAEQDAYLRSDYLICSSYAAVYGIVGNEGRSLFIADAVNDRRYYYDLAADPHGVHNAITLKLRDRGEAELRRQLNLLDELYGRSPQPSVSLASR